MAKRWLNLCLVVIISQTVLAFSPIDVSDEEWEQYRATLRDPAYRLPTTTRPSHYEVNLTPYFDNVANDIKPFSFDGRVTIRFQATEANVNQIVIHCNDLSILSLQVASASAPLVDLTTPGQSYECEMPYSFLRINVNQALTLNQDYLITSTFIGNLQTNMRGFYRSWYDDGVRRRWMATTQFQPGHARQVFPCYDEPGFKAYFDITMNRENDFSQTISNMPIKSTLPLDNGRTAETFYTTPKTSTYLLAFIVSHYKQVASNNQEVRPFHIYARANANSTGDFALYIGERLLVAMESLTNISYYEMAKDENGNYNEKMNMKQAAIPDFSAGAMENWGLLTYREALILYDEQNSNHFYRQRVANIVAHEIAHMWFGNLVTCAWWDNLWLNEGFARYYQYFLTNIVAPEMGYETRFIVEQIHTSMLTDSFDDASPLTDPNVNNPTTVSAHFSAISYAKGASILRMTEYLLGKSTYLTALRSYLKNRQYDVAEPHHLFDALNAAAAADNSLSSYGGITIDQYFKTWSEQNGHPLLSVNVNHNTGQMTVTQARFSAAGGVSVVNREWFIPVTWTRGGAPDFENLKPSQILTASATSINRGSTGREWVIFNKQQTGYYRVNYDPTTWALITQALRGNESQREIIHEYNRAQIVDDLFLLARSNVMPYNRALNILSFLEFENKYAPWIAAIAGFNYARRRLAHNENNLKKLEDLIIKSSNGVVNRLGFVDNMSEPYMDGLLRMYVMQFLCNVKHPQCVEEGKRYFESWKAGQWLPANIRPWVYCTGLRYGTAEDFDFFWNRYLNEDLSSEKVVMISAAGCTGNQSSLNKYLDAIVSGNDDIRAQDHSSALSSAITSNEENTIRAFEWLKNNIQQTTDTLGSINSPLNTITSRLLNEAQIAEVESWLNANADSIGTSAYNTGIRGIETSRANIKWYADRVPEFETYFETGYVNELDVTTTTTSTTAATTPAATTPAPTPAPTTPAPDSANVAALSLLTLLVTLAINL